MAGRLNSMNLNSFLQSIFMGEKKDIEIAEDMLVIYDPKLVLKLRSLGGGAEEGEENRITFLEAAFFSERRVIPIEFGKLMKLAKKKDKMADKRYTVLKYLREQGYIAKPSLDGSPYLRLYRKGFRPGEDRTYALIYVVDDKWKADAKELAEMVGFAGRLRKECVIAVVDGDEPKFLKLGRTNYE
jgi:tRNA splicing endonuclease